MELEQIHMKQPHQNHNLVRLQNMNRTIKKQHRLKIDVSKTQYPLIRNVAHGELGWKVWTKEESKEQINLYWIDTYINDELLRRMKPYQKVNHIPGSQNLGKKNQLTANIARMKKMMPKQYKFYPNTFNFPAELEEYEKLAKNNDNAYFIVKPCSDSQGRGIYITKQFDTTSKEQLVVQQYIQQPLLIDKSKFDLRVYVLLKSLYPLKIYVYQEGLCRLATSEYQKPQSSNQKNMRMHLTNYAINKLSPNFIFNKSQLEDSVGHKRSLSSIYKTLSSMGYDSNKLKLQIDKIIVKTILAVQPALLKKYKQLRDNRQENETVCFEILGFDILLKQNGEPLLLEVNHSPSFCTETPLDLLIKKCLILDTLNLINLNYEDKISYIKSRNQQDNISSNQIFRSYAKNVAVVSEPESTGGYRRIYPVDNPEHLQLSRLYQNISKASRQQKVPRVSVCAKQFPESLLNRNNLPHLNDGLEFDTKQGIDKLIFKTINQRNNRSLSLYHVINNLKRTKLTELRNAVDYQQFASPISLATHMNNFSTKSELIAERTSGSQQFNPQQHKELIRQEEVTMYEKRIKKDRDTQKRKYITPLPLANVNIRLDQKFSHRAKEDHNKHYKINAVEGPFKIHSILNTAPLIDRKQHKQQLKEDGNKTAINAGREGKSLQEKFRMTERTNRFNSYSIQLKQKIEKMQLARVRIQKLRKVEKSNFIIIKSQVPQQKELNTALINSVQ